MYFSEGSIIADSHEMAKGLMVITSGHIGVELPMDSAEADEENRKEGGKTLLFVFGRGWGWGGRGRGLSHCCRHHHRDTG
jgi:hypothetical protein